MPQEPAELATFLLAGMKDSREQLRSGVVEGHGTLQETRDGEVELSGQVKIFCAFEYDSDLFRFDIKQPARWLSASATGGPRRPDPTWRVADMESKYALAADCSIIWRSAHPFQIQHHPRDADGIGWKGFDLCLAGIASERDLRQHRSFEECIDNVLRVYRVVQVVGPDKGIYALTWAPRQTEDDLVDIWWIDEQKGFSPIRSRASCAAGGPAGRGRQELLYNEASWENISGVWVPTRLLLRSTTVDGSVTTQYDLTFSWQSVNKPVDAVLFTAAGFGLKHPATLWDCRPSKPVRVGVVAPVSAKLLEQPLQVRYWRYLAAATGLLLVICGVLLALRGIRSRRRHR